jgi:hypothetical protein
MRLSLGGATGQGLLATSTDALFSRHTEIRVTSDSVFDRVTSGL